MGGSVEVRVVAGEEDIGKRKGRRYRVVEI
jgi:hypothetical protein